MKKAVAFGFFVLAAFLGAALVIIGITTDMEMAVWFGMLIIAIGIMNLAAKIVLIEDKKLMRTIPVETKKPKKRAKKGRKR